MSSTINCNGPKCESEVHANDNDQWIRVKIEIVNNTYISDFCPTCWMEMLIRKAAVLNNLEAEKS